MNSNRAIAHEFIFIYNFNCPISWHYICPKLILSVLSIILNKFLLLFVVPLCIWLLIDQQFRCTCIVNLNNLFSVQFFRCIYNNSTVLALINFTIPRNVHIPQIVHLWTGYHIRFIWIGTFIRGAGHILVYLRSLIRRTVFMLWSTFWRFITALWSLKIFVDAVQFIWSVALRTACIFNYYYTNCWNVASCNCWLLSFLIFMRQLILHLDCYVLYNYFHFLQ